MSSVDIMIIEMIPQYIMLNKHANASSTLAGGEKNDIL